MPELKCTVQTCIHNHQFLCDKDKIEVGGSDAKTSRETCCDSFQERKADSYQNAYGNSVSGSDITGSASEMTGIYCRAEECVYNHNKDCHAGRISVEGSNACQCEGTECATFSCTCK